MNTTEGSHTELTEGLSQQKSDQAILTSWHETLGDTLGELNSIAAAKRVEFGQDFSINLSNNVVVLLKSTSVDPFFRMNLSLFETTLPGKYLFLSSTDGEGVFTRASLRSRRGRLGSFLPNIEIAGNASRDSKAMMSILYSQLIPGAPVSLILVDPEVSFDFRRSFLKRVRPCFYDSASQDLPEEYEEQIQYFLDFAWVRGCIWRDFLRSLSSKAGLSGNDVSTVHYAWDQSTSDDLFFDLDRSRDLTEERTASEWDGLLILGWLLRGLRWRVAARGKAGIECLRSDGKIGIVRTPEPTPGSSTISLETAAGLKVSLERSKNELTTYFQTGAGEERERLRFPAMRPIDMMSRFAHFGSSMQGYKETLTVARELFALRRAL